MSLNPLKWFGAKSTPDPQPANSHVGNTQDEVALIETSCGVMMAAFWPEVAPATVANFKKLARSGFYNNTAFHRIMPDFMIQGGDPNTRPDGNPDDWGTGGPGYSIKAEFNDRQHVRGVLSMARSNDPDSAGSQFFICLGDATFLDRNYTAFGALISGDDVLKKISETPIAPGPGGENSRPTVRVEVVSITIAPRSQPA